ncbi:uncharacterized protein [Panulirus ornatus]|uniref:uncharacterized protein n=1 Tax=Panulirus ornatus TaxID=150431 RepID=UPI003A895D2C
MGRQGARGILEVGQQVMESFSHNMRGLVHLLTGRSSPDATHTSPPSPDSRFFTTHQKPEAIISPGGCGYGGCPEYGLSVCESISDLVFPMVGKSALTNTTVTIVQSFPDLVQPVFFRKCRTHQAQVIHGYCIQEYLPISFYVSPPYPGAVLAQDFIMVESGCHVKADVTHHKWKTQARDISRHDNSTNKVYGNVERMRESDRRLF